MDPCPTPQWTIDREHDALLIVDLQPDFMPGGPLAVADGDQVVPGIAELLSHFSFVVATQDWHPEAHISFASQHGRPLFSTIPLYGGEQTLWPEHCVQGTPGAALHQALPLEGIGLILRKGAHSHIDSYSAFRENLGPDGQRLTTGLGALLLARGVRRLFVCGLARDFCVGWSAMDAKAEGLQAIVLDDLTRSVFPERIQETDEMFAQAGVAHGSSCQLIRGTL